ncbi:MAG: SDR family oxidoreductase [Verrucomicrobia bacterium]|nr:SDR family oxidoreductase [Verrucomicrobiota bacterium]
MKRAFITGANRGLGLALVAQLLSRGDRVIAGCRQPDRADALQKLARAHQQALSIVAIDVDDETCIRSARQTVASLVDAIDILVNNAAILRGDTALTMTSEAMLESYRTNTVGPVLVIRHFLDLVRLGTQPVIINISSAAGSLTPYPSTPYLCSYGCTKSALNLATRCIAHELAAERIPVAAVYPGWVRTDMGGKDAPLSPEDSATSVITNVIDRLTMERTGEFLTWTGETCPW